MASAIFNSFFADLAAGNINPATGTFYVLLCDSSYVVDKDAHTKRSDIAGEVSGSGYTAGGKPVSVTVAQDLGADLLEITLGGTSWSPVSVTARFAIYFHRRGGAASADELVAAVDFGVDKGAVNGTLSLTDSVIQLQN